MRNLYRIYQWLIAYPLLCIFTILVSVIILLGSLLFGDKYFGYYPARIWSRVICIVLFVKVKVKSRELIDTNTSYVFVANHQGAFDIFSIYGYLGHNFKWMMKKSLEKIPFVGLACKAAGHILVDRRSSAGVKRTMEEAKSCLKNGMSLVVFPEGSRCIDGRMREFKKGAFKLATDFGMPIVPITIDGAYDVMSRSTFNVTPGTITLTIHEPIQVDKDLDENPHEIAVLMQKSVDAIESSLPERSKRLK